MPRAIPSLLQLIWRSINIENLSLPLGILDPTTRLGIHTSSNTMEGIKSGNISEGIITNPTGVCAASTPVVSGPWRFRSR